jgi:hypothetical protein
MDIGAIISSPTKDPEWIKKCAITGLLVLIPIAGILNMMGWMKAAYERAKVGDQTLPDAGLNYIGSGWMLFLAVLPVMLVLIVWNILVMVLSFADVRVLVAVANLIGVLISLTVNLVLVPALTYRHVVHGKGFADGFDIADIMRVITTNSGAFVSYALVTFLANLIGGLGAVACCIGIIVSLPFAAAVTAVNISAFENQAGV